MLHPVIDRLEQNAEYLKSHWSLPLEDARFLYLLCRIGRFRNMLEIGTSVGYSTLHLALSASKQGGKVTTIDASLERQEQAKQYLQEADLLENVTLLNGDALTVLKTLLQEHQIYDFIFIDARKSEYIDYLMLAERLLSSDGVLLADNTRSHRKQTVDFIEQITHSDLWEVSDLETPNGFVLARKRT
jgi:predicted O-methyltransferase YrrM